MILDTTTRTLEVILGEAIATNQCAIVADWFDTSASADNAGCTVGNSNGVTAVTAVGAPAASTKRIINALTIFNADTIAHGVTVRYNDNTTLYKVIAGTLQPGETLTYVKSAGWRVLDANGNFRTAPLLAAIRGVIDGSGAAAGDVGEVIKASVTSGSPVSLTNNVFANMTSITLTAGDWDVNASFNFGGGASTAVTRLLGNISEISATFDSTPGRNYDIAVHSGETPFGVQNPTANIAPVQINVASTTTIYAVAFALFTVSTCNVFGLLRARRAH